jgi:hypothetical protein
MGNIKDNSLIVGSMGVVAGGAVRGCHRVIHVLFGKRNFISLVAFQAEGRGTGFQQKT